LEARKVEGYKAQVIMPGGRKAKKNNTQEMLPREHLAQLRLVLAQLRLVDYIGKFGLIYGF
jgi:hypothetical protein